MFPYEVLLLSYQIESKFLRFLEKLFEMSCHFSMNTLLLELVVLILNVFTYVDTVDAVSLVDENEYYEFWRMDGIVVIEEPLDITGLPYLCSWIYLDSQVLKFILRFYA